MSTPEMTDSTQESDLNARSTALIKDIDLRYSLLHGRMAMRCLGIWLAAIIGLVVYGGWRWSLLILIPGGFLLAVFIMRMLIHRRAERLSAEVDAFITQESLTLDALLEHAAAATPPKSFFISLMDGPLAQARRNNDAA